MIQTIHELPEEMTTRQVLAYLGITEKVLRTLRRDGYIEPLPGNPLFAKEWVRFYRREDVERLKKYGRQRKAS